MNAQRPPRPTLAKVALLAQVSTATASNVLTGKGRVGPETIARVQEAARRIGYRTDAGARALSRGRTPTVGVLVSSTVDALIEQRHSMFWGKLFDRFVTTCTENNATTAIGNESRAQLMLDAGIDVLVLIGEIDTELLEGLAMPFGLPVLTSVSFANHHANVPSHDVDAIAATVCDEFRRLGRTRIAWMPGPISSVVAHWHEPLSQAARARGQALVELAHDDSEQSLADALDGEKIDAIFGLFRNPRLLIESVNSTTRSIPSDVAIIVQSEGVLEEVTTPTLTTLSMCGAEYGQALAEQALALATSSSYTVRPAKFELVRRSSTSG